MTPDEKNKPVLNKTRDYLVQLFCRFVVAVILVLILINGIKFFKFLFYLVKKELHEQTTHSNF
mgnify:FL=1|jgi:hypothetical protein